MKSQIYAIASLLLLGFGSANAQSKIKDGSVTGSSSLPNANSVLELESNRKGFLLPRIALTATNAATPLSAHIAGMTVYNTATNGTEPNEVTPGYYYNDGSRWVRIIDKQRDQTVDVGGLAASLASPDPFTGATFDPALPANPDVIYVNTADNTLWTYDVPTSSYVTYSAPNTTEWYLNGSSTEAGGNKIRGIYRNGNVAIGVANPEVTAALDVSSTTQGVLVPRMVKTQRDAIANPPDGLLVYCYDCVPECHYQFVNQVWIPMGCSNLTTDCSSSSSKFNGSYNTATALTAANTVQFRLVNNTFSAVGPLNLSTALTLSGAGAAGISIPAGQNAAVTIAAGASIIISYNLTGTPTAPIGSALNGSFSFLGLNCDVSTTVGVGAVATLVCGSATNCTGLTVANSLAYNANLSVPYTVGNGGPIPSATFSSTGVTGLTATLAPATALVAGGSFNLLITGTPSAAGTAAFALSIGGRSCTANVIVVASNTFGNGAIVHCGNSQCNTKQISFTTCSGLAGATVNDILTSTQGVEYDWTGAAGFVVGGTTQALVEIGGQCWYRRSADNLHSAGSSRYYAGGPFSNEGRLYDWAAAMNGSTTERAQGICPTGFHVPSDCEYQFLEKQLGMTTVDQMAFASGSSATTFRNSGSVGAKLSAFASSGTNVTGFSALLSGQFSPTTGSTTRGSDFYVWTSSPAASGSNKLFRNIDRTQSGIRKSDAFTSGQLSVRCLRD